MPMFDFHCSPCASTFELLVRGGAVPCCPKWGQATLVKQISQISAPGKTAGIIAGARKQAAREGHFSNYSRKERPRT